MMMMTCNKFRPGFELVSPCSFPTTITITPRAPPYKQFYKQKFRLPIGSPLIVI